jgi:hypothetical protein
MPKKQDSSTALKKVIAKEIAEDLDGFTDKLFEIAKRKVVEEHNNDMVTALSLLFLLTKDKPTHPSHQIVLDLMKKYDVAPPPNMKIRPGNA